MTGFMNRMAQDHVSAFAAQAAFFILMSFVPFLMLLLPLVTYVSITKDMVVEILLQIMPDAGDFRSFLFSIIQEVYDKSTAIVPISAVFTLWSAGKDKKQIAQRERPHFRGNILGEERMGFIGLFEIRSHFGQQLVTGNSDIDGEFQLFSDPFPDLVRYFVWPAKQVNGFCHVQKGLIDAEFLNIRGIFGKQVQHLSGITGVNIKAGGHDDEFRTLAQG